jgi:hypothetical protein
MQDVTAQFPFAYHVLPIFAVYGVWADRALKSKANLPTHVSRPTTAHIDGAMGFSNYVHCYLARDTTFEKFPILAAQLGPSPVPPFPHVLLQIPTTTLLTEQAIVCNWTIAISRPNIPGVVQGGNWSRGTRSERIVEIWQAFRASAPSLQQARGLWYDEYQLPVLRGSAIRMHLDLIMQRARGNMPELLLPTRVDLPPGTRIHVFSQNAFDILAASTIPPQVSLVQSTFPGYAPEQVDDQTWTSLRHAILDNKTPSMRFVFDAIRKRQ